MYHTLRRKGNIHNFKRNCQNFCCAMAWRAVHGVCLLLQCRLDETTAGFHKSWTFSACHRLNNNLFAQIMSIFITMLWHQMYVCGSTASAYLYDIPLISTQLSSAQHNSTQLNSSRRKCCLQFHFVFPFCLMLEHGFHFVRHYLFRKKRKTKYFFLTDLCHSVAPFTIVVVIAVDVVAYAVGFFVC